MTFLSYQIDKILKVYNILLVRSWGTHATTLEGNFTIT
jgi:hypothetical protein